MAQKIPKIRTTNIFYFIPQIAIILIIILILKTLYAPYYILTGLSLYFLISIYLKVLIPKWHRKGIYLLKKGKPDLAILAFQRSYQYFRKYQWIDKYRAFTLLSTSSFSYCEMALMNMIFCFEQMGDKKSAQKFHNILKENFPNNRYV
jgi:hypothetical protein